MGGGVVNAIDNRIPRTPLSDLSGRAEFRVGGAARERAGAALLDRIGPAILLTHSQSGTFGWLVADARPNLAKAIIAMITAAMIIPADPSLYSQNGRL